MARVHVLTAAILFGTTGTAQALGPDIDPLAVGSARIVVGAALLALIALAAGRARRAGLGLGGGRGRAGLGSGDRRLVLLAGLFVALYQASFFAAVADTGVAVGTVVALGSAPAFTGLFSAAFAGERLERRWFAATGLACAGVCLLTLGGSSGGEVSATGIGLALAAGAGYAGYAVIGKHLLERGGTPEGVMAAVFGIGALALLPALLLVDTGDLLTADGLALAAYLGVVTTAVAYLLFARGLQRIGASETATLTLAEPVTAMALGFAVLGERPGAAAVAGAALVLAGLALLAVRLDRRPWRAPRTAEAPA
jgi:drug/metabolite transporter, DME family